MYLKLDLKTAGANALLWPVRFLFLLVVCAQFVSPASAQAGVGTLQLNVTYLGLKPQDTGANFSADVWLDGIPGLVGRVSSDFGVFPNLPEGSYTLHLRASFGGSGDLVPPTPVVITAGQITLKQFDLGRSMGLVSGTLLINGETPGVSYIVTGSTDGSTGYATNPSSSTPGQFFFLLPAGTNGIGNVESLANQKPFNFTIVAGQTTFLTVNAQYGALQINLLYLGKPPSSFGAPFLIDVSLDDLGFLGTMGDTGTFPGIPVGNHLMRLRHSGGGTNDLLALQIPISAGVTNPFTVDLVSALGLLKGRVTVNGQVPTTAYVVDATTDGLGQAPISTDPTGGGAFAMLLPVGPGTGHVENYPGVSQFSFVIKAGQTTDIGNVVENVPPTAAITSPTNNAVIPAGTNLTIMATAADSDGTVVKLALFFNGTTKLGETTNSTFTFTWTNVPLGVFTLSAIATDNSGGSSPSAPVTITSSLGPAPKLVIGDTNATPGVSNDATLRFPVTLSAASSQIVTVDYATSDGTALSPGDYVSAHGQLTFQPGQTTQFVNVIANRQSVSEPTLTFFVTLSAPTNATIQTAQALGTIKPTFNLPTASVNSVGLTAPTNGPATAMFTVTLSATGGRPITIDFATTNGTGVAGTDYVATNGTLTFPPGDKTKQVAVTIDPQSVNQATKTFSLLLSAPVNATLNLSQGIATILPAFPPPSVTIHDATLTAPTNGVTNVLVQVALSAPSGQTISVDYGTRDDSAIAPTNYTAVSGTLVFNPGETNHAIVVSVNARPSGQPSRDFLVILSKPQNASLANAGGLVTILSAAFTPGVTVADAAVTAPLAGVTNAVFRLALSAVNPAPVSVAYTTVDNTAISGVDYRSTAGAVTFAPGVTNQTVTVTVNAQTLNEATKTFYLQLSDPTNATLTVTQVVGTILSGVAPPTLALTDATVTALASGATNALFRFSLSAPSGQPIAVNYATANGTALAGVDYLATSGSFGFAPGETNQTVSVAINPQTVNQAAKTFYLNLSAPLNVTLPGTQVTATILSGVAPPTVSLAGATVTAPLSVVTNAALTVSLSAPSGQTVTVNYATADDTAVAGSDYAATNGVVTFAPGQTRQTIGVVVFPRALSQSAKDFLVRLSAPVNATLLGSPATVMILSAVPAPTLTVSDAAVTAPPTGVTNAAFTLSLSAPSAQTITVNYATADGSARAGVDYTATSGKLTFPEGTTNQSLFVTALARAPGSSNVAFLLNLSQPQNAPLGRGQATGLIRATAAPPRTIAFTAPLDHATFCAGASVPLLAAASGGAATLTRVDYYAASTALGSGAGTSNLFTWDGAASGDYALTARAVFSDGVTLTSAPVVIAVSAICGQAAIVRGYADPEIDQLQSYLFELGFSSRVFDQAGLTAGQLQGFQLVIWDGLGGGAGQVSADTVGALQSVFNAGVPLYLIGERLAADATALSEPQRSQWIALTHLQPGGAGGNGTLQFFGASSFDPISNGRFGGVSGFSYADPIDPATLSSAGAKALALSGEAVVMATFPPDDVADGGETRIVSEALRVADGADADSLAARKTLFENVVCWLMRCPGCSPVDVSLTGGVLTAAPAVNAPLTYQLQVTHAGQCEAIGANVTDTLPAGARFVSADSPLGVWTYDAGANQVNFDVGHLAIASSTTLTITVIPRLRGALTNNAIVRISGPELTLDNNAQQIVTPVGGGPQLSLTQLDAVTYQLRLSGDAAQTYAIQSSTNLTEWLDLTNALGPDWSTSLPLSSGAKFYRAVMR